MQHHHHQAEESEVGGYSRLPKLPPRAKVKSDRLSFREPGFVSAVERLNDLNGKIAWLEAEEEGLVKEQEEFRAKCQKEATEVLQRRRLRDAHDVPDTSPLHKAWSLLAEVKEAFEKAMSPGGELRPLSTRLDGEHRMSRLREAIDMEARRLQEHGQTVTELHRDLEKLIADMGLSTGAQAEEPAGSEDLPAKEDTEDGHDQDNNSSANGAMGPDDDTNDKGWTAKEESKSKIEEIQRALTMVEDETGRAALVALEEQIKAAQQERDSCQSRHELARARLRTFQASLEEKAGDGQRRDDGTQEDMDTKDSKQLDDGYGEWKAQKARIKQRREMRQTLRRMTHSQPSGHELRKRRSTMSTLTSDSDESEVDDVLGELDMALRDVKVLEDWVTNARWRRDKAARTRDLRTVLGWERYLESNWLKRVGQRARATQPTQDANPSAEEKDHLAGNPLQDFDVYRPLERGEIRLLVLMPSPKDCPYYPLICTLETESWEGGAMRDYAALSYHWGPVSENGRLYLLLDGLPGRIDEADWGSKARSAIRVPIRDNLFRALLRLRRHDRPVALWVDNLCIDQHNNIEKSEQLSNMAKIYHYARNVCVWLGEGDAEGKSDRAMAFIPSIMDFAVLDRYVKDKQQAANWHALAELMRDRWFSRRWVVQEISLADSATVHCGGETVHWSDFADAVSLLASNQESIKSLFDYSEWREGPNTIGDVTSFGAYILLEATSKLFLRDANGGIRSPRTNIESLVTSLTTFDTSDPRDLIYGLVSIARDTSRNSGIYSRGPGGGPRTFVVDYSLAPLEVYRSFTIFCIGSSRSLDIICRPWAMPVKDLPSKPATHADDIDQADDEDGMPSWMPLLSDSQYGVPAEVYSGRKNGISIVGPADRRFPYAASPRKRQVWIQHSRRAKRTLTVRGFKLARIEVVSARNTAGVILQESLQMGSWAGIQNQDKVPDQIWRTLVADRDSDGQSPPVWYQRACMRCLEIADTFNNGDLNIGELLQGHSELLRKYLYRVRDVTWNRTFFNATMLSETYNTVRLGEHRDDSDAESDYDSVRRQPDGGAENAGDKDGADDGDHLPGEKSEADENDEASVKNQNETEISHAGKGHGDVPTINGAGALHEKPGPNGLPPLAKGRDEKSLPDRERTQKGHRHSDEHDHNLFGLGPPRCKKGDFVCILYGCSVPVVLREASPKGSYVLVGEAYVHGKMEGEAVADLGKGRTWGAEEIFNLR